MAKKLMLYLGVTLLALSLASPGFSMGDNVIKGTVTKIEGNQVTITIEPEDMVDLKENDHVIVKSQKMMKHHGADYPKEGTTKPSGGN